MLSKVRLKKQSINWSISITKDNFQLWLSKLKPLQSNIQKAFIVWNILGASTAQIGKLDEAIEAYNKCISLKPDYAEAYSNMGNALKDQGKLDEAIEAYNKALSLKPDYAEAYSNMGVLSKIKVSWTRQ